MVTRITAKVEPFTSSAVADSAKETVAERVSFHLPEDVPVLRPLDSSLSSRFPSTVLLGFLRDGRLRLRIPFEVLLTEQEGQVVAESEELNEFGMGDNQTEAITELQYSIADLYFTLEEERDRLGKGLQQIWETLQAKIERR